MCKKNAWNGILAFGCPVILNLKALQQIKFSFVFIVKTYKHMTFKKPLY